MSLYQQSRQILQVRVSMFAQGVPFDEGKQLPPDHEAVQEAGKFMRDLAEKLAGGRIKTANALKKVRTTMLKEKGNATSSNSSFVRFVQSCLSHEST